MTITSEQIRLAEKIDAWVNGIVSRGGGDEQILEGMHAYMDTFKQILDTTGQRNMNALCQRYDGFYRFAKLLELLAQGVADGVITVPEDAPRPGKKRPRKPKPRRRRNKKESPRPSPNLIRRSIDYLPAFTEIVIGSLEHTDEQYDNFMAARHRPHVLDDALVDRAVRLYEEQLDGLPDLEQQLRWLLEDDISEAQRYQVEDLLAHLPTLRDKTEALLDLLAELRKGTINRILEMDDEELGRRYLRGEL